MGRSRKSFITLILLMGLWVSIPLSASETCEKTTQDVEQFVETNFDDWKGRLAIQSLLSGAVENIAFTKDFPLPVSTITADSLQNYAGISTFKSTLITQNTWYVPIISNVPSYLLLEVSCYNGELKLVSTGRYQIAEQINQILNTLKEKFDVADMQSLIVKINTSKRLFLAVEKNSTTTIYPLLAFPNQYASLQPIDDLGGYSASEVLLLIATEFLSTANLARITSELEIIIPKAAYFPATATGATDMFEINLKYLSNAENKWLFEVIEYQPLR